MIPRTRQLRVEDFPSQGDWIEPLLRALNEHMSQTTGTLSRQITFGENVNATLQTLTVQTKDDWVPLTLVNSWANIGGEPVAAVRKSHDGTVFLRGHIEGGASSTTLEVTTLPDGYRPASGYSYVVEEHNAAETVHGTAFLDIEADGRVFPHGITASRHITMNAVVYWSPGPALPNGCFPVRFAHKLQGGKKPAGCWVVAASDITNGEKVAIYVGATVAWAPSAAEVVVHDIPGLMPSRKYSVTFLVIAG